MTFFISLQQIYIMFILMAIGFFCRKKGMIHDDTIRKGLLNPNIIATMIGFALFLTEANLHFPAVVGKSISYVASLLKGI